MKPIFPVNLCKLVDRLFAEFKDADYIHIASDDYLTTVVSSLGKKIAVIHLSEEIFLTDVASHTAYEAYNIGEIKYWVGDKEAVSGLEIEKSMKKLRAIVHCCQESEMMSLPVDGELLKALKVLDSIF